MLAAFAILRSLVAFFRTAWGRRVAMGLVLAATAAGAYWYGRFSTPAKVVTKVETREKVVTQVQTVERVKVVRVADKARKTTVHRIVTETKKPDGTDTRVTETVATADTHLATTATTAGATTTTTAQTADTQRTDTPTLVPASGGSTHLPDWSVGALVGTQLGFSGGPLFGPVLYGARVERRILGPFYVGVWGVGGPGTAIVGGSLSFSF